MKDRFALAILLSLVLHVLLLEMVSALDFLWPAAKHSSERHVIPIALVEMNSPADPLTRREEGDGQRPLDQERSAGQAPLESTKPAVHVRKEQPSPPQAAAAHAEEMPRPAELVTCAEPTGRPLPEAVDRQEQKESPAVSVATLPVDSLHPAGSMPLQDAGRCETAAGSGGAVVGVGSAGGGSSRGDAAGGGGQGDGKAGQGRILIPGEFLSGNAPPRYPLIARRKGWEGTVVIELRIADSGQVQEARIEKSSGHAILDDAALGAVRNWRIAPNDRANAATFKFRVPVIFKLTPS
jgi:protein TonB